VHSTYRRRLADAPISGRPVEVVLRVRRFFCDNNAGCGATTFAEQVPGLTTPRARRTGLLTVMVEAIGLALAGRAGSRLANKLGMVASRDSMLRLVRALPDPPIGIPLAQARPQLRRPVAGVAEEEHIRAVLHPGQDGEDPLELLGADRPPAPGRNDRPAQAC